MEKRKGPVLLTDIISKSKDIKKPSKRPPDFSEAKNAYGFIVESFKDQKREQTVSNASPKALAEREQTVSKPIAAKSESVSNASPKALAEREQPREQSVSKPLAKSNYEDLVGKEKKLLTFVFHKCQITGSLESPTISSEEMMQFLEIGSERLRNVIYRLCKKGILTVSQIKNGRSSWRKFRLSKETFQQLTLNLSVSKPLANREHSVSNASPKAYAEALAEPSSSSSVLNIKNITTTEENLEWDRIDLGPSEKIGLSRYHVSRARELYPTLSPEKVQNLIYRFEKHLAMPENRKAIRNPGAWFLSLAEKLSKGESPLPEYKTPDEELVERISVEALQKREKYLTRLKALQDNLFENWWVETPLEEKSRLMPAGIAKGSVYKTALRSKWLEEVWPISEQAHLLTEQLTKSL